MSEQGMQFAAVMQEQKRQELRRRMAVQRRIDLAMNSLIQGMVGLVDKQSQVTGSRMEKHQIKNLLSVALETPSVEVVKHYVLYQVGRDTPGTGWRQDDFGKKLVKALDGLRTDADRITGQVHRDLRLAQPDEAQVDETWMWLVRAYLGQLNRYFYYRKEETRWPQATS
jgi:hypothetical protein